MEIWIEEEVMNKCKNRLEKFLRVSDEGVGNKGLGIFWLSGFLDEESVFI